MDSEQIIISKYCMHSSVEPEFIFSLRDVGLIQLVEHDNEFYICSSQLANLERYTRWYYELSVNAEGIDVIENLLERIDEQQQEITRLKELIKLLE